MPEPLVLPFTLAVPEESRVDSPHQVMTRRHAVHGLARLTEDGVVLEWSGTSQTEEVSHGAVRQFREPFPPGRRAIPLGALAGVRRHSWWWRPRVELRVRELAALEGVPTAAGDRLELVVARGDLDKAGEFVRALRTARR